MRKYCPKHGQKQNSFLRRQWSLPAGCGSVSVPWFRPRQLWRHCHECEGELSDVSPVRPNHRTVRGPVNVVDARNLHHGLSRKPATGNCPEGGKLSAGVRRGNVSKSVLIGGEAVF